MKIFLRKRKTKSDHMVTSAIKNFQKDEKQGLVEYRKNMIIYGKTKKMQSRIQDISQMKDFNVFAKIVLKQV